MRWAWVVVAAVVFGGLLWLLLDRPQSKTSLDKHDPGVESANPTLQTGGTTKPEAEVAEAKEAPAGPTEATERSKAPRIEGTLVIREQDGTERPVHEYRLELEFVDEDRYRSAKVEKGRWAIEAQPGRTLRIGNIHDGERAIVLCDEQSGRTFATDAPLALVARPITPTRLRV